MGHWNRNVMSDLRRLPGFREAADLNTLRLPRVHRVRRSAAGEVCDLNFLSMGHSQQVARAHYRNAESFIREGIYRYEQLSKILFAA